MRISSGTAVTCRFAAAATWWMGMLSAASAAVFQPPPVTGTTPSGIPWSAVASGSVVPVRSTGTLGGLPGAVAYWNTETGQLQIDPKGWNITTFSFTYTTGTVNVRATTPGPLLYASGTVPLTAVISGTTGLENQRTLPAGAWAFMECSRSRVAGIVSLSGEPSLASAFTPGNGASGTSTYATDPAGRPCIPGWFNQPWSFPLDMIDSGSVASMQTRNWTTFGITGTVNGNVLGYGILRSVFSYSINGLSVVQFGAVIPVPEPSTTGSLAVGIAVGLGHVLRQRRLPISRATDRRSGGGSGWPPPR